MPEVLGLDIGGANLKAATSKGRAVTLPFPLWKQPDKLTGGIIEITLRLASEGPVAVTMTGELCDCFPDKRSGVRHILNAINDAVRERPVFVWRNDGKWASINHALEDPQPVAAANWLASATYAGRYLTQGPGWFFDLGSTTLDMIPMENGRPIAQGRTDLERLRAGELAYLGARRTPVTSLVSELKIGDDWVSVATELFASIDDVFLILQLVPEDEHDLQTADGRSRTIVQARQRLARMICSDAEELGIEMLDDLAQQIMDVYRKKLSLQLREAQVRHHSQVEPPLGGLIMAGSGEGLLAEELTWLAHATKSPSPVVSMTGRIGPDLSTALAAYAVAVLLSERQSR